MNGYKKLSVGGRKVDEHRYIWEQCFGPIPEGAIVHHKNGDKRDNRLENLELVESRAAHCRVHGPPPNRRTESPEGLHFCLNCRQHLPTDQFSVDNSRWSGLYKWCRTCRSKRRGA